MKENRPKSQEPHAELRIAISEQIKLMKILSTINKDEEHDPEERQKLFGILAERETFRQTQIGTLIAIQNDPEQIRAYWDTFKTSFGSHNFNQDKFSILSTLAVILQLSKMQIPFELNTPTEIIRKSTDIFISEPQKIPSLILYTPINTNPGFDKKQTVDAINFINNHMIMPIRETSNNHSTSTHCAQISANNPGIKKTAERIESFVNKVATNHNGGPALIFNIPIGIIDTNKGQKLLIKENGIMANSLTKLFIRQFESKVLTPA